MESSVGNYSFFVTGCSISIWHRCYAQFSYILLGICSGHWSTPQGLQVVFILSPGFHPGLLIVSPGRAKQTTKIVTCPS